MCIRDRPSADWTATLTTETSSFRQSPAGPSRNGKLSLQLPSRCLLTLTTQNAQP